MNIASTVEPLYNGHHWELMFCLVLRGVPTSGASSIFLVGAVCVIGQLSTVWLRF